jgi:Tfp pilus assembly protein PilF
MLNTVGEVSGEGAAVVPLRSGESSAEVTLKRVRELADVKQFDEAREQLTQALEREGERTDLLLPLAEIERESGHHDQAMSSYERAVVLDPADPVTISSYIRFLSDSGIRRKALEILAQTPDAACTCRESRPRL